MVHPNMLYELARNFLNCHTVPNEALVNRGDHRPGSNFELMPWSQGEVRHTFVSSRGAPEHPTDRPATPQHRRRLCLVGVMVDLELTLRNLAAVEKTGGGYHLAMVERANRLRGKVEAVLKAVDVPELATVMKEVPLSVDVSTTISPQLLERIGEATRQFLDRYDGTSLGAIDGQISTGVRGAVYEPTDK